MCVVIRDSSTQAASQDSLQHSDVSNVATLYDVSEIATLCDVSDVATLYDVSLSVATPYDVCNTL